VKALTALVPAERYDAVSSILSELFPRIGWVFGGSGFHNDFDYQWAAERRVCSGTHFDKYFHAAVPAGDVRQDELDEFIDASADIQALRTQLQKFKTDGRILRFLSRLEIEHERIPLKNTISFLSALFDEADELPDKIGMLGSSGDDLVSFISYHCLRRFRRDLNRERVLTEVMSRTISLYAIVRRIAYESPDDKEADPKCLIARDSFPRFRDLALDRIRQAAETGALLRQRKLFAARFSRYSTSQGVGSIVAWRHAYFDIKALEQFVDPAVLEAATLVAPTELLCEEELVALRGLREAMDLRRAGKPDRRPLDSRRLVEKTEADDEELEMEEDFGSTD